MNGRLIDEAFSLNYDESSVCILEKIKEYVRDSSTTLSSLEFINTDVDLCLSTLSVHKTKLERLSDEIYDIESRNAKIKKEIENLELIHRTLSQVLIGIEIDERHFKTLEMSDFADIPNIRIALSAFQDFKANCEIKAVLEKKEKVSQTIKNFLKRFFSHFSYILQSYEHKSAGELKLHTSIYEKIRSVEFIIFFCKKDNKETFIMITQKYLSFAKNLYEQQFENYLKVIYKALKGYSEKLQEKMKEVVSVLIDSFMAILRSESIFVKRVFFEKREIVADYLKNMFSDVVNILLDFLRDCFRLNKIFTLNSLQENTTKIIYEQKANNNLDFSKDGLKFDHHFGFHTKETKSDNRELHENESDFMHDFYDKFNFLIIEFRQEILKNYKNMWKSESRRQTVLKIAKDLRLSDDKDLNKMIVIFIVNSVVKMEKGSKGKIEFCILRMKMIFDIESADENSEYFFREIKLSIKSDLEKETVSYVFGGEDSKVKSRFKNIQSLIKDIAKNNDSFLALVHETIKIILYQNASNDQIQILNALYDKFA